MNVDSMLVPRIRENVQGLSSCEHRAVSKSGEIICGKIAEGDNRATIDSCRTCPFKAVRCAHLRFTLRQTVPSPIIVRFNGRTEIWDDDPPEVRFERAACAAKVMPISHPKQCTGCGLRCAVGEPLDQPVRRQWQSVARGGKVVPFTSREFPALTG